MILKLFQSYSGMHHDDGPADEELDARQASACTSIFKKVGLPYYLHEGERLHTASPCRPCLKFCKLLLSSVNTH